MDNSNPPQFAAPAPSAPFSSPPNSRPVATAPAAVIPQPVVKVLSPRGVEYVFLTICLFIGAGGLIGALLALVNGKTDFNVLAFPVAVLAVTVPIFAWLFLRLKKAEVRDFGLKLDASKRRSTQFTQIVTFIVALFTLIGCVSGIFTKLAGQYKGSLIKLALDALVILVVDGGILVYYWLDEHKAI